MATMNHDIPLCRLRPGQQATVQALYSAGGMRRRLTDIGLIPGSRVTCIGRSPGGDPAAYRIRGAVIAIRDEDARRVQVRLSPQQGGEETWD